MPSVRAFSLCVTIRLGANSRRLDNESGEPLGYIAEEPRGFLSMFSRQLFRTHRPFRAVIMDHHGSPILWVRENACLCWSLYKLILRYATRDQTTLDSPAILLDQFSHVRSEAECVAWLYGGWGACLGYVC